MTQIQAASISAIPQQANRESRSASTVAATDPAQIEQKALETLEKSVETGDRDAQEQYQGKAPSPGKTNENDAESTPPAADDPNSIWNLSVADDQPPPDLDIRG